MALTELGVKSARGKDKEYMLGDGRGLWLLVRPDGKKYWRLRYWVGSKEKKVSLGVYPIVGLKEAREKRDELARERDRGNDPSELLQSKKGEPDLSFEAIAREWLEKQIKGVRTDKYARDVLGRLERFIFPKLGRKNIQEITAPEILAVLRDIEDQDKVYSAHQASNYCSRIFRYAIAMGKAEWDPVGDLRGALQPHKKKHRATLVDVGMIAQLLTAMRNFYGTPIVKAALWFSAYTFCRPGDIVVPKSRAKKTNRRDKVKVKD